MHDSQLEMSFIAAGCGGRGEDEILVVVVDGRILYSLFFIPLRMKYVKNKYMMVVVMVFLVMLVLVIVE